MISEMMFLLVLLLELLIQCDSWCIVDDWFVAFVVIEEELTSYPNIMLKSMLKIIRVAFINYYSFLSFY